jgi:hypothetical protein
MRSGKPKANVLPEPVLAFPQTSLPSRASGIVSSWTGNGDLIPISERAAVSSGDTPREEKVVGKLEVVGAELMTILTGEPTGARGVHRRTLRSAP